MDMHDFTLARAGRAAALALGLWLSASAALAGGDRVCVENRDETARVFTVEVGTTRRGPVRLNPGAQLCAPRADPGARAVVSAYPAPDVLEGCSRLVTGTQGDALLRYAEFDRCLWASHEQPAKGD
jgi:hypothetical protein